MILTLEEIISLAISDFENMVGKFIKITLTNPIRINGENRFEIDGNFKGIGLSSNLPHLPISILIENEEMARKIDVNFLRIKNIELE